MKKIMFNDRYGLTRAVLDGRKTMTRRIIHDDVVKRYSDPWDLIGNCSRYHLDEEVAVAQPYKDTDVLSFNAYDNVGAYHLDGLKRHKEMLSSAGYRNKMFVKAEHMPYRIRITDIKVERLQDISEEDCLREGILQSVDGMDMYTFDGWVKRNKGGILPVQVYSQKRREAFAALIDRISGKGTWNRNPWVFAYEFELIK